MRAVIDTNVLVSGLLWRGPPHQLIEHARSGVLTLLSSPSLLAELAEVIARPKFREVIQRSNSDSARIRREVEQLVQLVDPPPLPRPISRDGDDDAVLALAQAARADLIVTGDQDLLILGNHDGIPIVAPAEAIARISA